MQWSRVIPEICARHGSVQASHPATIKLTDAINRLIKNIGNRAELPLPVHFHMLRHSCGYKLANDGRYQGDPRLARPRVEHAHHALHTTEPRAVQGFLAGLIRDLAGAGDRAGRGRFAASNGVRSIRRQAANTMTAVLGPVPLSLQ